MSFTSLLRNFRSTLAPGRLLRNHRRSRTRGTATSVPPRLEALEARVLLTAGDLDLTFGTGGLVVTKLSSGTNYDVGSALVIQSNGKILTGGYATLSASNRDFALVRYNADGTRDATFGINGLVSTDFSNRTDSIGEHALVLQPDGRIVAGGTTYVRKGTGYDIRFALARYLPSGALDTSFGSAGKVMTDLGRGSDFLRAVALQSDGKIVVAGSTNSFAGGDNFVVARYTANGILDKTFDNDGVVVTDFGGADTAGGLVIQGDDKIVVAGAGGAGRLALARYNPNGSLDDTFDGDGKLTTLVGSRASHGTDLAILPDGRIVAAGSYDYDIGGGASKTGFALAQYLGNGSPDISFGSNGQVGLVPNFVTSQTASSLKLQADGKIILVGTHQYNPGDYDFAVARVNGNGSPDITFGIEGWVRTDFDDTFGLGRGYSSDTATGVGIQPNGKIVVVGRTDVLGSLAFAVTRYDGDAALSAVSSAPQQEIAPLTESEAQPLLTEAIARWQAAGADVSGLGSLDVRIADLGGANLGLASGNTIWLDDNAAGWGWFVDATPQNDLEFLRRGNQGESAAADMDLLTVVMHELGHLLGHDHDEAGVMAETLAVGVRRTDAEHDHAALVDQVFSQPVDHHADGWLGAVLDEQLDSRRLWFKRRR